MTMCEFGVPEPAGSTIEFRETLSSGPSLTSENASTSASNAGTVVLRTSRHADAQAGVLIRSPEGMRMIWSEICCEAENPAVPKALLPRKLVTMLLGDDDVRIPNVLFGPTRGIREDMWDVVAEGRRIHVAFTANMSGSVKPIHLMIEGDNLTISEIAHNGGYPQLTAVDETMWAVFVAAGPSGPNAVWYTLRDLGKWGEPRLLTSNRLPAFSPAMDIHDDVLYAVWTQDEDGQALTHERIMTSSSKLSDLRWRRSTTIDSAAHIHNLGFVKISTRSLVHYLNIEDIGGNPGLYIAALDGSLPPTRLDFHEAVISIEGVVHTDSVAVLLFSGMSRVTDLTPPVRSYRVDVRCTE
jgi:hypothetical protein